MRKKIWRTCINTVKIQKNGTKMTVHCGFSELVSATDKNTVMTDDGAEDRGPTAESV